MTPSVFYAACLALWGSSFRGDGCAALKVSNRSMRSWIAGDQAVPLGVQAEIRDRLVRKRGELSAIVAAIVLPPVQS